MSESLIYDIFSYKYLDTLPSIMEDNPVNIPLADNADSACSAGVLKELSRSL